MLFQVVSLYFSIFSVLSMNLICFMASYARIEKFLDELSLSLFKGFDLF